MPPLLPRKRLRTPSPHTSPPQKRIAPDRKVRLDPFAAVDSTRKNAPSAAENRAFLDALEDDQSSLSEADSDSDDFEDVIPTPALKKQKTSHRAAPPVTAADSDEDSEDDLEFEDVAHEQEESFVMPEAFENFEVRVRAPGEGEEPISLTLKQGGKASITKKMRRARILAHCMHVQYLMWHNVIRNSWINDKQVHEILLKGLPDALKDEVKRWKLAMGYEKPPSKKAKGKKGSKGKPAQKSSRERIRDWGADTEKSDQNTQADPLIRLLKYLAAYWKKRFVVTAPSLRKLGYRNPRDMRQEIDSFNDEPHDPARHGERISDLDDFRALAKKCRGSRDVGAQLFTALLRGLGIEARMVASLQPTGFGWSKVEEAHPRKDASTATTDAAATESDVSKVAPKAKLKSKKRTPNGSAKGSSNRPINLDSDASSLSSSLSSENEGIKLSTLSAAKAPPKRFDRDLVYPTYWTEALSPVSNTYIPISTMLHPNVITSTEHIGNFEPRGAAAEKSKQVMAYVLAFSADGTAKDVTVRYLRKRQWPGKTKGFRIPIEKLPIYNSNGKIIRHEEYDWFKRIMRGYARPGKNRTLADDIEDDGDLVPLQPETDEKKKLAEPDTLQGYKQSPDFVLERHLRREEALRPGSKPVKHFHAGKGEKATKEPVFKRSDVVIAKSAETWHKEGRHVRVGEQPVKKVAYRAVTLLRKREIEDQTRDMDGVKPTQGLYAEYQTEWIIPDPIGPDRAIPRNAFNNIDVYVPSMVPRGAIHIPLKGTAKVCKRLGIDFAEACTGFEFGKQRAVPVITGVVVAEENEDLVIDAWREDERVRQEKDGKKREERSLKLWKKFLRGLRVRDRIEREYGSRHMDEDITGISHDEGAGGGFVPEHEEDQSGGFLRSNDEGMSGGFTRNEDDDNQSARGFMRDADQATEANNGGGGFLVSEEDIGDLEIIGGSQDPSKKRRTQCSSASQAIDQHLPTPISLQAMHAGAEVPDGSDDPVDIAQDGSTDEQQETIAETNSVADDSDDEDDLDFVESGLTSKKQKSPRSNAAASIKKTQKANSKAKAHSERQQPKKGKRRSMRNAAATNSPYFSQ